MLRSYQKKIIETIFEKKRVAIFAECGLGKSRCIVEVIKKMHGKKVMIVAPKFVCSTTWKTEFQKWNADNVNVIYIEGTAAKRKMLAEMEADVYVISRDNIDWYFQTFGEKKFDMIVLDESTSFKNVSSKRWKAMRHYTKLADMVVELTGTPVGNGFQDLFGQIFLLDNGIRLGTSITRYREKYFDGPVLNGYKIYNKMIKGSDRIIMEKVKDITYSLQAKDYLEMPERIDNIIPMTMTGRLEFNYRQMRKDYCLNTEIIAANAAVLTNKLAQLANGFVYDDGKNIVEFSKHKIEYMQEVIDTTADNILIFAMFQRDIDALKKLGAVVLNNANKIREWQEGKIKIAVAHPASIGYGINLQSGGHVLFWYSLPWSLELYQQSNARLYRQGQTHPVIINHLITEGTIEENILQALQSKNLTQETLLRACKMQMDDAKIDKFKKLA